jgi:4-amino-4-deoxy-L-arabinose transferase-like glycosyltransferase
VHSRTFLVAALIILAVAAFLRGAWLTADPPVRRAVGIVWHDEGAWVHNARNQALWGTWRTDAWNPVFVAPVFTALEYASFVTLGVGTWQARVVPAVSGLVAVAALMIGLHVLAGRRAAVIGGLLLGTNYAFVMWNRAALMESTMTAFMVVAWMAWVLSERRAAWGLVAGLAAVAAFFTKAAAAFFIAALALELALTALNGWRRAPPERRRLVGQAAFAAAGLAGGAALVGLIFVLPHWTDYQFYNWQMSVTRKPSYSPGAFIDRATWLPIVQGLFSGMLVELLAGLTCLMALVIGWKWARPAERLLVLWVLIGLAELVAHDSGNERRYVMFIPALVALASLLLGRSSALFAPGRHMTRATALAAVGVLLPVSYVALGSLLRPLLIEGIEAGYLRTAVRTSAAGALILTMLLVWRGPRLLGLAAARRVPGRLASWLVAVAVAWNLVQWVDWASTRTSFNHDASVALGALVADGTLVHGKLANGMALENRIRPLFVGNSFGNYADRLQRDDARYILTYDLPRIGYESSDGSGLIQGILDHYPSWRVVATFQVDETRMEDRAVLIDKFPDLSPAHARD